MDLSVWIIFCGILVMSKTVTGYITGMNDPRVRTGLAYGMGMGGAGGIGGLSSMGARRGVMTGGARSGQLGTVNSMANNNAGHFPVGVKMIDGELMDVTNKVIQKVGTVGSGTQYFSFMNPRAPPVFRRREIDTGRHFIVFPDANFLPGDGHYIVMRKVRGVLPGQQGPMYEVFYLDLGDSVNALVSNWNSLTYQPAMSSMNMALTQGLGSGALANKMMKMKARNG